MLTFYLRLYALVPPCYFQSSKTFRFLDAKVPRPPTTQPSPALQTLGGGRWEAGAELQVPECTAPTAQAQRGSLARRPARLRRLPGPALGWARGRPPGRPGGPGGRRGRPRAFLGRRRGAREEDAAAGAAAGGGVGGGALRRQPRAGQTAPEAPQCRRCRPGSSARGHVRRRQTLGGSVLLQLPASAAAGPR